MAASAQPQVVENTLSEGLGKLSRLVRQQAKSIEKAEERQDFTAAAARLEGMAEGFEQWNSQQMAEAVYWVEAAQARRGQRISLAATPIDVGPILREQLFNKVPTVVMTSATLATAGKFDFFQSRVGLLQAAALSLGSPFNYEEQAELILARWNARSRQRGRALRANGDCHDPALRGADRRPGLRALHQLRDDAAGRGRPDALARRAEPGPLQPGRRHAANADDRAVQGQSPRRACSASTVSGKASTCRAMPSST